MLPSLQEAVGPFPCFKFSSIADTLDAAHVSWKYYAPPTGTVGANVWSEFDALSRVRYGKDWKRSVISPETTVINDAKNGNLPGVAWVVPDWINSDHGGSVSDTGPAWVASVVDAIGDSKDWNSTVIFVLWDDWGGWYDDANPPQYDYTGLGNRVPCIVISPFSRAHRVSHTRYEFGSILRFIEETFALPPLQSTDVRSASMADNFDFKQTPLQFQDIDAAYSPQFLMARRPSFQPPDNE
jgi:phospholipase C